MNKRLIIGLIIMILIASSIYVQGALENTEASACTFAGCSVANYNDNSTSIGSSLTKGDSDVVDIAATADLGASDTINQVDFSFRWTNVVNLDGFWDFDFRSQDAATSYCLLDNVVAQTDIANDEYAVVRIDSGCTSGTGVSTKARLDDLEVLITNNDGGQGKTGDVLYINLTIDYSESVKPRINSSINNSAPTKNEVVNISANVTDNIGLSFCQFITNQSSGAKEFINNSVSGTDDKCSQNFTISLARGNVINFTVLVNDTSNFTSTGNKNQSEHIITVANFIPTPSIVFPTNDLKTNLQPLDLNVTFEADRDNDVINISYYIDGVLNQTQIALNTTFNASDGVYILNVTLFDNVTATSYSSNVTVNFTIDTVKPIVNLSSPVNIFNSSSENVTFKFNVTDNIATSLNCSIYIDAILNTTNSSTLNGTDTSFKIKNFNEGAFFWNVTCLDEAGNSNTSETRNFTVDLSAPLINKITFSPNSTDDIDPDVFLNFTVNVTDSVSSVKTVVLQYKQSGAGLFTNATMEFNSGSGLYNASFTPDVTDTWNYRIYASDYAGNNDSSDIKNISVENDRTWNRKPSTFDNLACGFSKTCKIGNLTINNTGDFTLNFDLGSNFGDTSFNKTEPFDLAAKGLETIEISLTAGSSASESNVVITIDATTSNADPDSDTTNFTFTTSAGGPVFDLTIVNPPTEVNKSDAGVIYLNASLKNIGNETAGTTWINWTLPANWLNISGTNLTKNISTIAINEIVYHNITVNLTSSASTGTQKVNVTAASNNSGSDSAAASIVVVETSTSTTTTTTTTTTTGGGGGGGSGGGGGGIAKVPVKPEEIEISQTVELVRGEDNSFEIEVENIFEDSVLENLTLQVEGFLSQYLTIIPDVIRFIPFKQSRSFTVTVAAPAYKGYEEHTLKATVTGMVVKTEKTQNVTVTSRNPFTLKNFISLIIHESSKEQAGFSLEKATKAIEEMQKSGFPVKKSLKLLEEIKEKLNIGRYQLAKEISSQINNIKENAFSADTLIHEIRSKIFDAENKGLQVEETRKLLNLALAAFEREDYLTSIQRAKDAQLSIVIETKGKFNVVKFIIDYWWPLVVMLIALSISGYFARKKLTLIIISRRLGDLQKEEVTINELMKETQEKYYKDKKISTTEYHKAMYGYEKRLSEVSQLISRLRSKRVGIIEISNEIRNLKKEDDNVVNLIKQLQDGYYSKQTITRKVYLKRIREYKVRRIEIERSIAVLEAKLAKKERLEELKAKEVSKKKIISKIEKKDEKFKKLPPITSEKNKFFDIKKSLTFIQKLTSKLNLVKLFGKDKHIPTKVLSEKDHSKEVHELLSDLIKRKDKPKPIAIQSKESIETRNKLAIKDLFTVSKEKTIRNNI